MLSLSAYAIPKTTISYMKLKKIDLLSNNNKTKIKK